jgi:predicted dehydrogenase
MPASPDLPPRSIRWGILGCARITRRGLAPGILASKSGTLHALASRDESTARAWADEFGASKAYGDYRSVLDDPEVDAVYLPLPNELHLPWVVAAADAGKHILCEKPLALDAAEADRMVEHCRSRGVILMEAFMWRHQPRTASLVELVRSGGIGRLRLVRSSFSFPIEPGDWRLDPSRGGGALWDVGCYGVSTCRLFAGSEPVAVRSMTHPHPSGVDLTLTAELAFPEGVIGLVDCSFEAPFRCEYELVGTTGSIRVPDAYLPPDHPTALRFLADSAPDSDSEGSGPESLSFEGTDQYARMVDAFAQSVANGALVAPAEDGLAQMKALDWIKAVALLVGD